MTERRRLRNRQQRRERRVLRAARLRQGHAGVAARELEAVEGEAAVYLVPRLDAVDGVAERLQRVNCRHGCFGLLHQSCTGRIEHRYGLQMLPRVASGVQKACQSKLQI